MYILEAGEKKMYEVKITADEARKKSQAVLDKILSKEEYQKHVDKVLKTVEEGIAYATTFGKTEAQHFYDSGLDVLSINDVVNELKKVFEPKGFKIKQLERMPNHIIVSW